MVCCSMLLARASARRVAGKNQPPRRPHIGPFPRRRHENPRLGFTHAPARRSRTFDEPSSLKVRFTVLTRLRPAPSGRRRARCHRILARSPHPRDSPSRVLARSPLRSPALDSPYRVRRTRRRIPRRRACARMHPRRRSRPTRIRSDSTVSSTARTHRARRTPSRSRAPSRVTFSRVAVARVAFARAMSMRVRFDSPSQPPIMTH